MRQFTKALVCLAILAVCVATEVNLEAKEKKPAVTPKAAAAAATKPTEPAKAPECCEPSEVQKLRLENLQLKRALAQKEIAWRAKQSGIVQLQEGVEQLEQEIGRVADAVRIENGWPEGTTFDAKNGKFTAPAPPAKK